MGSSVIITVVVVLAIIVAGGFLLYFMGDLFMSLAHKSKDDAAIKAKQEKKTKELEERVNALENSSEARQDPQIATILYNGAVVENYNPDEEEVSEEEQTAESEEQIDEEPTEEEKAQEELESEENEDDEDDVSDYIKQRRAELMARLARMQQEDEEEEEEEEEEVDIDETSEETEETNETEEETQEEVKVAESEEEPAEEVETAEDAQSEEEETDTDDIDSPITISLEELEKQLAEAQEKLKANEKELRKCKKEFIPLRRVKKTLESDEKKLRRKEALVAKQKVVLYGVNNYSDIDEEKAKKLAEDLDLLDGLKLSVQHCEEVMNKNAERYPLLEQIFNLLSSQNAEIKENIQSIQNSIDQIKNSDTDDNTDAE